jgi:hypothetical protein
VTTWPRPAGPPIAVTRAAHRPRSYRFFAPDVRDRVEVLPERVLPFAELLFFELLFFELIFRLPPLDDFVSPA